MAYGTASGPEDVERYYTDIRGGRTPSAKALAELKRRYAAIGNRFPLLDITRQQAEGLERELNAQGIAVRAHLGMKHSEPFIADTVTQMREEGIRQAVGIVMAPHWSGMSVETYVQRVEKAAAEGGPDFTFIRRWYAQPEFVEFLSGRVAHALGQLFPRERDAAAVIFSAHSLPVRAIDNGELRCLACDLCEEACRYRQELQETADLVAGRLGLPGGSHTIAWQSAGHTPDPWWGPPVDQVIGELAAEGHQAVVVCSAGFVADHLEILYDLDVEAQEVARVAGIRLVRTEMPNADPAFLRAVAAAIREHVEEEAT
jgi:ferrochelatase